MKKIIKKIEWFVLIFAFICCCSFILESSNVYAASVKATRKRACSTYITWISKNVSKFNGNGDASVRDEEIKTKANGFMLADLDKNGVPELIICHPMGWRWDDIYIYTYSSKKMIQVKDEYGKLLPVSANNSANGGQEIYTCKNNHLHVVGFGGWWSYEKIYTVKNGKMKLVAKTQEDRRMSSVVSYEKNGKSVGEMEYKTFVKKCKAENYKKENTLRAIQRKTEKNL